MKFRDTAARAGRSLRQAKARTLLTSLAIAVGAFTLTLGIAAGEGARQYADRLISSNVDPQSLFVVKDGSLVGEHGAAPGSTGLKEYSESSTQYGGASFKALDANDIKTITEAENVQSVQPSYLVQAKYISFEGNDKKYTTDVIVYDASVLPAIAAGSVPSRGQQISDESIVVPESFLKTLGVANAADVIGKKVTLRLEKQPPTPTNAQLQQALAEGMGGLEALTRGESRDVTFTVGAVSAKSSTSFSASSALFISENQAKGLSEFLTKGTDQYQKYISATVKVKDSVNPETVKTSLSGKNMIVKTAKDLQGLLFTIVNILQGIVIGFGILALIASVFGIINTQYISVLERTSEIGLMKALGMRGRHVRRLFLLEAAWIGVLGGTIGALLAVVSGTLLNPLITQAIGLEKGTNLLIFQLLPIVLLVIALMLVAVAAGFFPSRKAAKLDPIEALRTE